MLLFGLCEQWELLETGASTLKRRERLCIFVKLPWERMRYLVVPGDRDRKARPAES